MLSVPQSLNVVIIAMKGRGGRHIRQNSRGPRNAVDYARYVEPVEKSRFSRTTPLGITCEFYMSLLQIKSFDVSLVILKFDKIDFVSTSHF